MVRKALEYLDPLAREAGNDAALPGELAMAYQRVGDVQGNPFSGNLGDPKGALESYRKALAIREALLVAQPDDRPRQRDLTAILDRIGDILRANNDPRQALEHFRRSLETRQSLAAAEPGNLELQRDLNVSHNQTGQALTLTGDSPGALASFRKAVEIAEGLIAQKTADAQTRSDLAISCNNLGDLLLKTGDPKGAVARHGQALACARLSPARIKTTPGSSATWRSATTSWVTR